MQVPTASKKVYANWKHLQSKKQLLNLPRDCYRKTRHCFPVATDHSTLQTKPVAEALVDVVWFVATNSSF
jgi:hypothetical protein